MLQTQTSLPGQPSRICRHCHREWAIIGEGPDVGMACVFRLGDAAGRPERLSEMETLLLLEDHGDAVKLIANEGRLRWLWILRQE